MSGFSMLLSKSKVLIVPAATFVASVTPSFAFAAGACVPAREEISVPHSGQYHRIHPSGNYFMYTDAEQSVIVDITDRKNPKTFRTPMREEAYPVEAADGGWELIAAPVDGGGRGPKGGTDFYRFKDLTNKEEAAAKPTYTDPDHGQYYLSAAQLPGSTEAQKKVRTLLYSDREYRDYTMDMNKEGSVDHASTGKQGHLCSNLFDLHKKHTEEAEKKYYQDLRELFSMDVQIDKAQTNKAPRAEIERLQKARDEAEEAINDAYYGKGYTALNRKVEKAEQEAAQIFAKLETTPDYIKFDKKDEELVQRRNLIQEKVLADPAYKALTRKVEAALEAFEKSHGNDKLRDKYTEAIAQADTLFEKLSTGNKYGGAGLDKAVAENDAAREDFKATSPQAKRHREAAIAASALHAKLFIFKDGNTLDNPVLSKDGQYVAGLAGSKLVVLKINADGSCAPELQTEYRGSKVSFSYPEAGKKPKITFTVENGAAFGHKRGAYVYDLETRKTQHISKFSDQPYYPGYTKDGRIMYFSNNSMILLDPNQVNGRTENCVRVASASSSANNSPRSTSKSKEHKGIE